MKSKTPIIAPPMEHQQLEASQSGEARPQLENVPSLETIRLSTPAKNTSQVFMRSTQPCT